MGKAILNWLKGFVAGGPLKGYKRYLSLLLLAASAVVPPEYKLLLEGLRQILGEVAPVLGQVDPLATGGIGLGIWALLDWVKQKFEDEVEIAVPKRDAGALKGQVAALKRARRIAYTD